MTHIKVSASFKQFLCNAQENSRLARLLYFCVDNARYIRSTRLAVTTEQINYLHLRDDGTISFLPEGKDCHYNADGDWARTNRQNGKPSRVIRKILTPKAAKLFTDSEFEAFANLYQAAMAKQKLHFEILPASEIPNVYNANREDGCASLSNSCMNGDKEYVQFYTYFPMSVKIVALYKGDLLSGRALLWTADNGVNFLDRFYVAKEEYYPLFVEFAKENKFYYRQHYKTYDHKTSIIDSDGKNVEMFLRVSMTNAALHANYYPYIDTFTYGNDNYLTNNVDDSSIQYKYVFTGGDRDVLNLIECVVTGDMLDEDDAHYIECGSRRYRGEYCSRDYIVCINGDTYCSEDTAYVCMVGGNGDYVLVADCYYCSIDDCHYLIDDCVELHDGEYCLRDDAYDVDGNYYHSSEIERITAYRIKATGELFDADQVTSA